jgi:hypothetical protein
MLANDLANHIKTLALVGELPVRATILEAEEPNGIMVMTPLGGLNNVGEIPRYYQGSLQVLVRHQDPEEGYRIAEELMEALTVIGSPLTLENYRISFFRPRGLPIMYPVNDAGLYEHSVNFDGRATRL